MENPMKTKVIILTLAALLFCIPSVSFAGDGNVPPGQPFQSLQQQIDELKQPPNGTQVGPNLYLVHTRVLWDLGWLTNAAYLDVGGYFSYYEVPKPLVYGPNRTTFLSPLQTYGIPEIPANATRKVRLYVNYGHQWMCGGTPTVKIVSGTNEVEFSLPQIGGFYGDMGANWSDFKDYSEYQNIGHAQIQVYQKDFVYEGDQCGPYPGTGPGRPKGVVNKIEAHFYDQY